MARAKTPSTVMYAKIKELGISNHDAAELLLNTSITFDGHILQNRINESSQLSRRVVHTLPGELPMALFNNFQIVVPQLEQRILKKLAVTRFSGDIDRAREELDAIICGPGSRDMANALRQYNIDDALYRNMGAYIRHVDLPREENRVLLHLMMFVITGCTGNPKTASILVVDYATTILGADFHTAQTVINTASQPKTIEADISLGLVRVVDGHIKAGSQTHMLSPEGTELGLLPTARHVVADVDSDVSRSHALIWREEGHWYIRDLGSSNGTRVILGTTGEEIVVESGEDARVEISPTDIICLASTTRFIAMPVLGL